MMARWLALGVWAAAAASAVFWGLKLFTRAAPLPPQATVVAAGAPVAAGGDMTRLFGVEAAPVAASAPAPVVASTRFQLIGVAAARADRAHHEGVALIAIDGKPPRAFRVGARVDGEQILQAVQPRGVSIGPRGGDAQVALELPALPPPSTGTLPLATSGDAPTAPPPVQPAYVPQPGAPTGYVPPSVPGMAPMVQPRVVPGLGVPGARHPQMQMQPPPGALQSPNETTQ